MAAYAGNLFCLQWLLDHGADPLRWVFLYCLIIRLDLLKIVIWFYRITWRKLLCTKLPVQARYRQCPYWYPEAPNCCKSLISNHQCCIFQFKTFYSWKNICGQTAADVAASIGHNEAAAYLNEQAQLILNAGNNSTAVLKEGNFVSASNGYYGYHQTTTNEDFQDVLLCSAITQNAGCVGGRKRTREAYDYQQSNKRTRFVQEQCSEDIIPEGKPNFKDFMDTNPRNIPISFYIPAMNVFNPFKHIVQNGYILFIKRLLMSDLQIFINSLFLPKSSSLTVFLFFTIYF